MKEPDKVDENSCPVHGTILKEQLVPVVQRLSASCKQMGMPSEFIEEVEERAKRGVAEKWPYANKVVQDDEPGGMQTVFYCQDCRNALADAMVGYEQRVEDMNTALDALEQRIKAA